MTRVRTKQETDRTDGGAFNGSNRPPLSLVSKGFQTLFAELDALNKKRGAAHSELTDLIVNWGTYAETARKADGAAAATAARDGEPIVSSEHAEALTAKKTKLENTIAGLIEGEKLILNDLQGEREREQQHRDSYTKAEAKAREKVVTDLKALAASAAQLAEAIALREWLMDHAPFDNAVRLNVLDIWPPARATRTNVATRSIGLADIITAIENI